MDIQELLVNLINAGEKILKKSAEQVKPYVPIIAELYNKLTDKLPVKLPKIDTEAVLRDLYKEEFEKFENLDLEKHEAMFAEAQKQEGGEKEVEEPVEETFEEVAVDELSEESIEEEIVEEAETLETETPEEAFEPVESDEKIETEEKDAKISEEKPEEKSVVELKEESPKEEPKVIESEVQPLFHTEEEVDEKSKRRGELSKMKRTELMKFAKENGIKVSPRDKKVDVIEKIINFEFSEDNSGDESENE